MSSERWLWPDSAVVRIVDGDTLIAEVTRDVGFHGKLTFQQRLRLARINARPKSTTQGKSATAMVTELVTGKRLLIETVGAYKYGDEWMAEVTLPDGRNLSDVLVAAAVAVYWDGQGPRPDGPL